MPIPPRKTPTVRQMLAPMDPEINLQRMLADDKVKRQQAVVALRQTPYVADTLAQAVQNPSVAKRIIPIDLGKGVYGEADASLGNIYINASGNTPFVENMPTPAGNRVLRGILAHEMAHMAPNPKRDFPAYNAVARPRLWFENRAEGKTLRRDMPSGQREEINLDTGRIDDQKLHWPWSQPRMSPSESAAIRALDTYYAQNKESLWGGKYSDLEDPTGEGFAQAFTNAAEFLAENAKGVQRNYRERLGQLEGNTPGAGQIVQDLLSRDIYAQHPLQRVIAASPRAARTSPSTKR